MMALFLWSCTANLFLLMRAGFTFSICGDLIFVFKWKLNYILTYFCTHIHIFCNKYNNYEYKLNLIERCAQIFPDSFFYLT